MSTAKPFKLKQSAIRMVAAPPLHSEEPITSPDNGIGAEKLRPRGHVHDQSEAEWPAYQFQHCQYGSTERIHCSSQGADEKHYPLQCSFSNPGA